MSICAGAAIGGSDFEAQAIVADLKTVSGGHRQHGKNDDRGRYD